VPKTDPKAKSEYDRESYIFWKSLQRCVRCHKQDAYTLAGRARCAECVEINRAEKAAFREKNHERLLGGNKDWYYRMKAEHRCVLCARPLDDDRHTTCAGCRAKRRRKHAEKRGGQGANYPRGDNGICWLCNKRPAVRDGGQCEICAAISKKNLEKANAVRDKENHPWRKLDHAAVVERRATRAS